LHSTEYSIAAMERRRNETSRVLVTVTTRPLGERHSVVRRRTPRRRSSVRRCSTISP
jgi:hypothetical protein